jgi:alpha-methylacyl-CoA racemase
VSGAATGKREGDLAGITVLDLGGVGPASRCMRVLADLGARWINIAAPSGAARTQAPWYAYGAMRGVERLELDLKLPAGRDAFLRVAKMSDVVLESFRPGVAERLGIGYGAVSAVNPRIIYCAATGYGQTGPYARMAGHDLNYQALSGALAACGRTDDGRPALLGMTLADSAGGGWHAAMKIMSALIARERTGRGAFLDVAAAEGVLHLMALSLDEQLAINHSAAPGHGLFFGQFACYDIYAAADGGHLAVAAIERKFFETLCDALGLQQLAPRQYDDAAQPELRKEISEAFLRHSRDDWSEKLKGLDVCVSPVLSVKEVVVDPHWRARGMFVHFAHPTHGAVEQLASFDRDRPDRGPRPADDAAATLLESFGFTASEIDQLRQANTLGAANATRDVGASGRQSA